MNNEITNQMKIEGLTAEQAEILSSIIEGTIYPYWVSLNYKKEKVVENAWFSDFIEFYYYVSTDTHVRKEIKFYDWVIDAKDQIAKISESYK